MWIEELNNIDIWSRNNQNQLSTFGHKSFFKMKYVKLETEMDG